MVYHRARTTDPQPNLQLFYAPLVDDTLGGPEALPMTASTAATTGGKLSFAIASDGSQHIASELFSVFGRGVYCATRQWHSSGFFLPKWVEQSGVCA